MAFNALLPDIRALARAAGAKTLEHFQTGATVERKDDNSPVTIADQEAEDIIIEGLQRLAPDIPIIAEESVSAGNIPDISDGTFWLVDPLDGTKEFIRGTGEYTVNIALLENNKPVLGVIYAPAKSLLYFADETTAWHETETDSATQIVVRAPPDKGLTIVSSRSHGDPEKLESFLQGRPIAQTLSRGSSLKICMVAAGDADIYPRFGPTCEWDIAAGDAILRAAGGKLVTLDGQAIRYGKTEEKFLNPEFIASGGA